MEYLVIMQKSDRTSCKCIKKNQFSFIPFPTDTDNTSAEYYVYQE